MVLIIPCGNTEWFSSLKNMQEVFDEAREEELQFQLKKL